MPITDGYSRYECEVATCGKQVFAQSGNVLAAGYVEVKYIDSTGVMRTMVLCGEHGEKYKAMVELFDASFDEFAKTGETAIVSAADLLAVVSQLTETEEALAEMTKKRDQWHDKYKDMEAKYSALLNGGE